MKRVLLTGASGRLGVNILAAAPADWDITGIVHEHALPGGPHRTFLRADLRRVGAFAAAVAGRTFDAIIHTVALTNVDRCETERELAYELHVRLAEEVAVFAKEIGAKLVHISTDQVFDGVAEQYTEESLPHPINYYGETKWQGEQMVAKIAPAAVIVRTNFFGLHVFPQRDLVGWIVEGLKKGEERKLFTDIYFSPLYVEMLVQALIAMVHKDVQGLWHVAGRDGCSKYDFGLKLADALGYSEKSIMPAQSENAGLSAKRPKNMTLDVSKAERLLERRMPTVEESVAAYAARFKEGYGKQLQKMLSMSSS